ncbi:MAG: hypothetical protein JWO79_1414 [Actinomycetia bacterium]|jgi:hypothetical protein|nr:hypothetical protein [Actinomycetes bacterium]
MDDDTNQPIPPVGLLPEDQLSVGPVAERRSAFRPHMLLRPSGFLLVLMCFALPFLTVSCDSPAFTASATLTGFDLATGGQPTVNAGGLAGGQSSAGSVGQRDSGLSEVRPLAVGVLVLLVVAAVLVSVLPGRPRLWVGAAAAILGAVLLAVNQALVHRGVVDALNQAVSKTQDQSGSIGVLRNFRLDAAKLVHTRFGFWLALTLLLVLALYYGLRSAAAVRGVGRMLTARIATAGGPPPPPPTTAWPPPEPEPTPGEWARPAEPPG